MWKFYIGSRCGLVLVWIFYASSMQPVEECPNKGSVIVSQNAQARRPAGQVTLTCDFRVPFGQLIYLSWSIHEINTRIYGYNPVLDPPGIIDNHEIVVSVSCDVDETIGHSELVINTDINDVWHYKCVAYLQDYSYCLDSKQIEFKPPELEIQVDEITICRNDDVPCYPYMPIQKGRHVISGLATNCHRDHVLILSACGTNISSPDIRSNGQMYDRGFISLTAIFSSEDTVLFTITDRGQRYQLQYPALVTVCPSGSSVVVSQKKLVPRPSGQVTLVCDFHVPSSQPVYLSWSLHDSNTLICIYEPFQAQNPPCNTDRPDIFLNGRKKMAIAHSEIVIDTTVNDTQTYRCDVYSEADSYCFDSKQVEFEVVDKGKISQLQYPYPGKQDLSVVRIKDSYDYNWLASIILALGIALMVLIGYIVTKQSVKKVQNSGGTADRYIQDLM